MKSSFLTVTVLVVLAWTFVSAPMRQPVSRPAPVVLRSMPAATPADPPADIGPRRLEAHQPPVPILRTARETSPAAVVPEAPAPDTEAKARDDQDRKAAKAAVEADGYKRVSMLGKAANGTWRAKAYRGATEVQLTVDGSGRVSMD